MLSEPLAALENAPGHGVSTYLVIAGLAMLTAWLVWRFLRRRRVVAISARFADADTRTAKLMAVVAGVRNDPLLGQTPPLSGGAAILIAELTSELGNVTTMDKLEALRDGAKQATSSLNSAWLVGVKTADKAVGQLEKALMALAPSATILGAKHLQLCTGVAEVSRLEGELTATTTRCRAQLKRLNAANIDYGPGRLMLEEINGDAPAALASAQTDPLGGVKALATLSSRAIGVATKLAEMLTRKKEVEEGPCAVIIQVQERLDEMRRLPFVHRLPLLPGQEALPIAQERMLSDESDPDQLVEKARAQAGMALTALGTGDFAECDRLCRTARFTAAEALAQIDSCISARDELELELLPLLERLRALEVRVERLKPAYEELCRDHPLVAGDSPQRLYENVSKALVHSLGSLHGLQAMYCMQRFVTARETLRRASERIQRMQATLPDMDAVLAGWKAARLRVQSNRKRFQQLMGALRLKLDTERFAVGAAVSADGEDLLRRSDDSQLPTAWMEADTALQALLQPLDSVNAAIDKSIEELKATRLAARQANALLLDAGPLSQNEWAGQEAQKKLTQAKALCTQLEAGLLVAGSDWVGLLQTAGQVKPLIDHALRLIADDKLAYAPAQAMFEQAAKKLKKLGEFATGKKASAKIRAACAVMDDAKKAVEQRDWKKALALATSANASFQASMNARGLAG